MQNKLKKIILGLNLQILLQGNKNKSKINLIENNTIINQNFYHKMIINN